jgi:putative lipoprotein
VSSKFVLAALVLVMVLGLVFAAAPLAQAQGSAQAANCAETYTVAAGDTLGSIAQAKLGDVALYTQIQTATNAAAQADSTFATIADPNLIEIGWKLCIPAASAAAATTPGAPAASSTVSPTVTIATPLTLSQLGNATYQVQDAPGGDVTLANGSSTEPAAPGSASQYTAQIAEPLANGALDGNAYAAAVLITSGGGSGSFYNLAAVPNNSGTPGTGLTALLGDRIKVNAIAFENNRIKVDYLDRNAGEAFTVEPSVPVTKFFQVAGGALVEAQPGVSTAAATPPPPPGSLEGTYLMSSPAADASALLTTLILGPDGVATMHDNYVGKGVVTSTGTWTQTNENTAVVTFIKQDDKNINNVITFQLTGDTLTATQYDQGLYGSSGLTFYRATGAVTGSVTYELRIAIPENSVLEVYLVDASKADAPYTYLSGYSMGTGGKQVPLDFAIPVAGSQIQDSGNYLLYAYIVADGRLLFKNNNGVRVLTGGAPSTGVQIVVEQAQ